MLCHLAKESPMLINLGSFTRATRDIVLVPFIFDGRIDFHGLQLYKFF